MNLNGHIVLAAVVAFSGGLSCKSEPKQAALESVEASKAKLETEVAKGPKPKGDPKAKGPRKDKPVGATLHKKEELALADIPKEALAVVKKARPKAQVTGAEKEFKHGKTYIDVEAKDEHGEEVEFDMLLTDTGWKIAEIQRDLEFKDVPKAVSETLLAKQPAAKPARVIESDQGEGVIIYEFFLVAQDKKEKKLEVKFEGGKAELLKKEWKH